MIKLLSKSLQSCPDERGQSSEGTSVVGYLTEGTVCDLAQDQAVRAPRFQSL